MAFPTSPVDGQVYGDYKYNTTIGVWERYVAQLNPFDALTERGTINAADIDQDRSPGVYKILYSGYSNLLLDIRGTGSTPRVQLQFNYNEGFSFRCARDNRTNWDGGGFVNV